MNVRRSYGVLAWLLPALLFAGCSPRPAGENQLPGAAGGAHTTTAVSPTRVTHAPTAAPLDTAAPAKTATPLPTQTFAASATASGVPSDTPVPPSATPLPGDTATAGPAATAGGEIALPDTAAPPTATPTASSSPVPPDSTVSPGQSTYVIYSEQVLGEYTARVWVRANDPFPNMLTIGTIDRGAERLVQISDVAGFAPLPAADMTGEGQLDVAFALRWGGSHCCYGTVLYNLGDTPQQVLWVGGEIGTGTFRDLDGDGDWEFITRDVVAGIPCTQPAPLAVLAYSPAQGYAPASPQYPAVYEAEIIEYTQQAELRLQENGVRSQCDISDLMLDYLYSGQAKRGWAEFARLYTEPDAAEYRAALESAAAGGQLYVAAP